MSDELQVGKIEFGPDDAEAAVRHAYSLTEEWKVYQRQRDQERDALRAQLAAAVASRDAAEAERDKAKRTGLEFARDVLRTISELEWSSRVNCVACNQAGDHPTAYQADDEHWYHETDGEPVDCTAEDCWNAISDLSQSLVVAGYSALFENFWADAAALRGPGAADGGETGETHGN